MSDMPQEKDKDGKTEVIHFNGILDFFHKVLGVTIDEEKLKEEDKQ